MMPEIVLDWLKSVNRIKTFFENVTVYSIDNSLGKSRDEQ